MAPIPVYQPGGNTKIAIIQTAAYGDNINSTLMLKPLRAKYPNATIDLHTSVTYGDAFNNLKLVDNIIRHPSVDKHSALHLATIIPQHLKNSNYDLVLNPHPMYNNDKWSCSQHQELGENLIFAWVRALEDNNIPYNLPLETQLVLDEHEIAKVAAYREVATTMAIRKNYLMEIMGESGQSFWNGEWTKSVISFLLENRDCNVFVSVRNLPDEISKFQLKYPGRVFWAGSLSIRECAELFNYCQCFFSVSSGLSNACNTNWCRQDVQWVEVVNSLVCSSAAIRQHGKIFWHHNNVQDFIEMLRQNNI